MCVFFKFFLIEKIHSGTAPRCCQNVAFGDYSSALKARYQPGSPKEPSKLMPAAKAGGSPPPRKAPYPPARKATRMNAKASQIIRRPARDCYLAFVEPDRLTQFWLSAASATLEVDQSVRWDFLIPGATVESVVEVL